MTTSSVIPLRRQLSAAQIDRPSVIALVQDDIAYFNRAVVAGHDAQKVGLQRREQINRFVQTLAPNEALAFLNLYQEEVTAVRTKIESSYGAQEVINAHSRVVSSIVFGFAILSISLTIALFFISKYLFK